MEDPELRPHPEQRPLQKAKFQELVTAYEQTVLNADREAENGLVTFLRAQSRTRLQTVSVDQAQKAVALGLVQYKAGTVDFTRITQLEQNLVLQQNTLAQARGEIAQGLIQIYRALGGGWEMRLGGLDSGPARAKSCQPTFPPLRPPLPAPPPRPWPPLSPLLRLKPPRRRSS